MATKTPPIIDVKHIATLAKIPITVEEEKKLAEGFTKTLLVIDQLNNLKTEKIEPTHQVTGLANVFREDIVDQKRMLTQKQALQNAKRIHGGFFVVPPVLNE